MPPEISYFLLGARGTGKSTFLRDYYQNSITINLLDERKYQTYLADIGLFYDEISHHKKRSLIIVDEIQRLPPLLNEVHRLIEEKKFKFVLSGSSARKLRKSGVNLLAGRAAQMFLHPFVPEELGEDFDLEKCLTHGLLPIVWSSENPSLTLESYIQTYIKEEIQAEAILRNIQGFARFLPISALFHGQIFNTSSIARDAEVPRSTVESYFSILEDTLIGFKLPAFETKLRVRERKKPKFYFVDPGIARALRGNKGPLAQEERGHLFEGFIAQTLRAYKSYTGLYDEIFYWSPAEAKITEVDFLLKKGKEFCAIECKSSSKITPSDLTGLKAISDLKSVKKKYLVYLGAVYKKYGDIEVLPLVYFLDLLKQKKLN